MPTNIENKLKRMPRTYRWIEGYAAFMIAGGGVMMILQQPLWAIAFFTCAIALKLDLRDGREGY